MIVTDNYETRADGVLLVRTYSDRGRKIIRDGVAYDEAIDPADSGREYTESTEPVQLTDAEALEILTGGAT